MAFSNVLHYFKMYMTYQRKIQFTQKMKSAHGFRETAWKSTVSHRWYHLQHSFFLWCLHWVTHDLDISTFDLTKMFLTQKSLKLSVSHILYWEHIFHLASTQFYEKINNLTLKLYKITWSVLQIIKTTLPLCFLVSKTNRKLYCFTFYYTFLFSHF